MTTPLVVKLENKHCLVIGAGKVATRKIRFLLKEKANVTVISNKLSEDLQLLQSQFHFINHIFDRNDREILKKKLPSSCFLAVVATNDQELNEGLARELIEKVPLINVVDNQLLSNFFFPAYIKRGLLKIAVTTSGASPILARKIKEQLEEQFGINYVNYIEYLKIEREFALNHYLTEKERKDYLEKITTLL